MLHKAIKLMACLIFLIPAAASALVAEDLQVMEVRLNITPAGGETLNIILSRPVLHRAFLVPNPPRMVVDLPPFQWRVPESSLRQYNGKIVKNIRYARFSPEISRIVLDLAQDISFTPLKTLKAIGQPQQEISYRLVSLNSTEPVATPSWDHRPLRLPQRGAGASAAGEEGVASLNRRKDINIPPLATTNSVTAQKEAVLPSHPAPPREATEKLLPNYLPFSVVPAPQRKPEQVKQAPIVSKPLIVIDAGHGGQDPGTIGLHRTKEKFVTLAYATALKQGLEKTGKFHAVLTRSDDRFILLRERFKVARKINADLFISLHADSAPNIKARGLSVYTLSEDASDAEAAALAAQENKADVLADVDLTHQDEDVAGILIDLAQRETKNKSITLADHIVNAMQGRLQLLPNPHRFAGFAVLKAPDIPSALVEIGFLSHPQEEQVIQSSQHRERVVQGLIRGITNYFAQQRSYE